MPPLTIPELAGKSEDYLSILRYQKYAGQIRDMLRATPDNPATWLDLAFHLLEEKLSVPAREILTVLAATTPASVMVRKLVGDSYWLEQDFTTAQHWYQEAIALPGETAHQSYLLGGIHFRRREFARAADCYLDALARPINGNDPGETHRKIIRETSHMLTKLIYDAGPQVQGHLQQLYIPGNPLLSYWLGVAALINADFERAEPMLLAALPAADRFPDINDRLAQLYTRNNSLPRLEKLLTDYARRGKPLPAAWLTAVADDCVRRGEILAAARHYFHGSRSSDGCAAARGLRLLALDDGFYPKLTAALEQVRRDNETADDTALLAELHRMRGRLPEALLLLDRLQQNAPIPQRQEQIDNLRLVLRLRSDIRLFRIGDRIRQSPWQQLLECLGTGTQQYAFRGPWKVELKLTNRCNNDCIGCNYRSPLLYENAKLPEWRDQEMPLPIARQLINDLADGGVHVIRLSGGGEPLLYPQINDIFKLLRHRHIAVQIITNGTMLTPEMIETFFKMEMYGLGVSLWAATRETYVKIHPNRRPEDFDRIVMVLDHRRHLIARGHRNFALSTINVLNRLNFHEVREMYLLAKRLQATCIHYTMMLPLTYETDTLLLRPDEIIRLREDLLAIREQAKRDDITLFSIDELLHALGVKQASQGIYDVVHSQTIPCTVGWMASFFNPDGTVYPCAEAQCLPLGSVFRDSFPEIWNSPAYRRFRHIAYTAGYQGSDVFTLPRCWAKCDHHGDENARYFNQWLNHGRFRRLLHRAIEKAGSWYR